MKCRWSSDRFGGVIAEWTLREVRMKWDVRGAFGLVALTVALPGVAAEPEQALPACGAGEVVVWVPTGKVDPSRTKACQA